MEGSEGVTVVMAVMEEGPVIMVVMEKDPVIMAIMEKGPVIMAIMEKDREHMEVMADTEKTIAVMERNHMAVGYLDFVVWSCSTLLLNSKVPQLHATMYKPFVFSSHILMPFFC